MTKYNQYLKSITKYLQLTEFKMVLDIDRFRPEKGGNPQEVKENQRKRYSDESIVDKIVAADENWRKGIVKAHPSS